MASDNLGRRAALFLGSSIIVAGVALQCAAQSVAMFVGARFMSERYQLPRLLEHRLIFPLVGFGLAFAVNAAPLLITELAYPTQVCESVKCRIGSASFYGFLPNSEENSRRYIIHPGI